jgi:predicted alpha/beta superfamily hydrolase
MVQRFVSAIILALAINTSLMAQDTTSIIPRTKSWLMTSSVSKHDYQISIALPRGYTRDHAPYPVLYAADANDMFGTVVETARDFANSDLRDLIIVGIGYPDPEQGSRADAWRNLDLTPTADPVWLEQHTKHELARGRSGKAEGTGGAPAFMAFIRNELVPAIEHDYNVSRDDRAFLGHSFGALFGVYALLNNNGLFKRFVIASPSLWWNNRSIFKMEESFAASGKPLPARVFFAVGLLDTPDGPYAMVSSLRDLITRLDQRHYKGLDFQVRYFEDETHGSVIPVAIRRGLDFIYSKPTP